MAEVQINQFVNPHTLEERLIKLRFPLRQVPRAAYSSFRPPDFPLSLQILALIETRGYIQEKRRRRGPPPPFGDPPGEA